MTYLQTVGLFAEGRSTEWKRDSCSCFTWVFHLSHFLVADVATSDRSYILGKMLCCRFFGFSGGFVWLACGCFEGIFPRSTRTFSFAINA